MYAACTFLESAGRLPARVPSRRSIRLFFVPHLHHQRPGIFRCPAICRSGAPQTCRQRVAKRVPARVAFASWVRGEPAGLRDRVRAGFGAITPKQWVPRKCGTPQHFPTLSAVDRCRIAFRRDMPVRVSVRGPVLFSAFRRFASICLTEVMRESARSRPAPIPRVSAGGAELELFPGRRSRSPVPQNPVQSSRRVAAHS
jgi:hypothetical protein